MTAPVTRPLKAKESDGSVSVYPCTTLNFDSSDFNITATAQEATITTSGSAGTIGGSITSGQVAFGAATANSIEGTANFTFDGDRTLKFQGATPRLYIGDTDVSTSEGEMLLIMKSGTNSSIYDRDDDSKLQLGCADTSNIIRMTGSKITLNDIGGNFDTIISTDSTTEFVKVDATDETLGIGAAPTTAKAQLQVDEDATFTRYIEDNTANIDITAQMCHNTIQTMKSTGSRIYATLPDIDDTVPGMCLTLISHGGDISLIGKGSEGQSINGTAASGTEPTVAMDTTWSRMEVMAVTTSFWVVHLNGAIATVTNS